MQAQALEDILQRLEDNLACAMLKDDADGAIEVCINCWSEDGCSCDDPRLWPLSHAIGRIRSLLGFEGYSLLP